MNKRKSIFSLVISIITFIILLIGATFAFFNATSGSENDAISVKSMKFDASLDVKSLYSGFTIIPTNDTDIMRAYTNQCKDSYDNGACLAYTIDVINAGSPQRFGMTLDMTIIGLTNLSYLVLDEDDNVYNDVTSITGNNTYSLGEYFDLDSNESKKFKIILWVSNTNYPQDLEDAGGTFNASVSVSSVSGNELAASITGSY